MEGQKLAKRVLVIEAGRTERDYWADIWRRRELLYFLAWRDILSRYKQTAIGIAWSVIRPLLMMVVFTVVFGRVAKLPSGGAPYAILVYAGVLPWQVFANAVGLSSESVVANSSLVLKVYFPRIIIPISSVVVSLVDFVISFGILICLMAYYHYPPTIRILAIPLFLLLALMSSLGVGLWFSSLNVKYRDVRHLVPFIIQIGLYVSPVGFSSAVVGQRWRLLYSANPMVGVIDGFRWCILGGASDVYWPGVALSVVLAAVLLSGGVRHFRKVETGFADVI